MKTENAHELYKKFLAQEDVDPTLVRILFEYTYYEVPAQRVFLRCANEHNSLGAGRGVPV